MVAYLYRPSVAGRALNDYDRSLLYPMITRSDNNAADTMDQIVGDGGLWGLAARVGMTSFVPAQPIWGESEITVSDQTKFFLHIGSYIPPRHRAYALHLLASIVPSQRWGIGEVAPRGWHLYFKGGWGSGTGLIDNQVVLLTRGCTRVSIAVLTMHDASHDYGKETLKVIFRKLLKGLPTGPHSRYRQARTRYLYPNSSSSTRMARGGARSVSSRAICSIAASNRDSSTGWITITSRA